MSGRATSPLPVVHHRGSAFSYQCHGCKRCCYHKRIQLNPYEIIQLSRHLGGTTTEVIARFTTSGGTALGVNADGSCVFLGEQGCAVHAARPLACRLYPLGRIALDDGREVFIEHAPHPQTAGVYGEEGTVDDFLRSQDVEPWLAGAERYYAILRVMLGTDEGTTSPTSGLRPHRPSAEGFVDADLAVGLQGSSTGTCLSAEELFTEHIALLEQWVRELVPQPPLTTAD